MAKKINEVAREAYDQAKSEGLSDEDSKWMAVGAVNAEARKAGIIGKEAGRCFSILLTVVALALMLAARSGNRFSRSSFLSSTSAACFFSRSFISAERSFSFLSRALVKAARVSCGRG